MKCKSIPGPKADIHDAVAIEMLTKSKDPVLFNFPPNYILTGTNILCDTRFYRGLRVFILLAIKLVEIILLCRYFRNI